MSIDFQGIRQSHPIADTVGRYIELKRQGGEYRARCPFHNDGNPSFYVVPKKDKAFCMACGWHGDVIDFIAEFESVDSIEAARRLGGDELPNERPALPELPPDEADEWTAILPAPDDAPAYDPAQTYNPRRGRAVNWKRSMTRCDAYRVAGGRVLGYVVRMDVEGQKLTPTVVWARHRDGRECWASVKFPSPRPLQGLDALADRLDAPVLVVSGEKCREAAAATFPSFVSVTWPGGDQNVLRANWTPLHGRRVTLWPDADASGSDACQKLAAALYGKASEIRVIDPTGQPKGWDVADALADGMTRADLVEWIKPRVSAWHPEEPEPEPTKRVNGHHVDMPGEPVVDPPVAEARAGGDEPLETGGGGLSEVSPPGERLDYAHSDAPSATPRRPRANGKAIEGELISHPSRPPDAHYSTGQTWSELGLELSSNGVPVPNISNASAVLEGHSQCRGRFWYDEFLQRVMSTWNTGDEPREWSDGDDVLLTRWMQRALKLGKLSVSTVRDAVTAVALTERRNECREWLEALNWDGTERLASLLPIAFGTEASPYTAAVGRCWLVSMVARVIDPGCKVDTMPVFEGDQGARKSTAMKAMVGKRWFAEASESPTSKDFYQVLQGKMLVEIAEMDTFSRAEVHTIKRVISCQVDRYRSPYGRRAEDHPRTSVFAGTTNKDDWNRDETGARRFWPVACAAVDVEWLEANRTQLFAEAMARFDAGEPWWDVPNDAAKAEQEARRATDEWELVIDRWLAGRYEVTIGDVLLGALKLDADKWDKPAQMRAATALRVLGWKRATVRRGNRIQKLWQLDGGNGGNEIPL